ncbi:MAG: YiiX/YebB-like N1pC/P60 family cysteine hydrolase, partial [Pseudomonadota bacterium]
KSGQIIATSEVLYDGSTFIFEVATGSRYGHIGFVYVEKDGSVTVYESTPPIGASKTSVKEFLSRSIIEADGAATYQAAILETRDALSAEKISAMKTEAEKLIEQRLPYNYEQKQVEDAKNCSEFVHHIFTQVGIVLSKLETTADLNMNAFGGVLRQMLGIDFSEEDRFVSPAAIVFSNQLRVLTTTLPTDRILSEREIVEAWMEVDGGLESLIRGLAPISLPDEHLPAAIEQFKTGLLPLASNTPYRDFPSKPICKEEL